ncbi:hypothetical protein [Lacisediminimonas profundi]|uniref:hypothetical protein n=1 Tax=Lacisediminimonas profundi TaxID=2603856 RepID=UPI00124B11DB|nr:hypothetical protein [Lacisediminimonas profundi]
MQSPAVATKVTRPATDKAKHDKGATAPGSAASGAPSMQPVFHADKRGLRHRGFNKHAEHELAERDHLVPEVTDDWRSRPEGSSAWHGSYPLLPFGTEIGSAIARCGHEGNAASHGQGQARQGGYSARIGSAVTCARRSGVRAEYSFRAAVSPDLA